jgi:hypothetical protein
MLAPIFVSPQTFEECILRAWALSVLKVAHLLLQFATVGNTHNS